MASSSYYLGISPQDVLGTVQGARYFYGLRRTNDGELYFSRIDQILGADSLEINNPGLYEENYNDFQIGTDFFEGRNADHTIEYDNLKYEQYRWDDRAIYYYIDSEGQLVARINAGYTYPDGV